MTESATATEPPPDPVITPARRRMLMIFLPLLALTVVFTGLTIVQDLLPGTLPYRFRTEIAARPEITIDTGRMGVDLDLRAGSSDRIRIEATGGYSGEDPQVTIEDGRIEADCPSDETYECGIELEIELPPQTRVTATNRGGPIEVTGLAGALNLRTRGGQIRITEASGPIVADATNGRIRVDDSTSRRVTASTRNGGIDLDLDQPDSVTATSLNGEIVIDLGPCRPYVVEASGDGHESIDVPTVVEPSEAASSPTVTAKARNAGVTIDCG